MPTTYTSCKLCKQFAISDEVGITSVNTWRLTVYWTRPAEGEGIEEYRAGYTCCMPSVKK